MQYLSVIVLAVAGCVAFTAWACCKAGGDEDRAMEEYFYGQRFVEDEKHERDR